MLTGAYSILSELRGRLAARFHPSGLQDQFPSRERQVQALQPDLLCLPDNTHARRLHLRRYKEEEETVASGLHWGITGDLELLETAAAVRSPQQLKGCEEPSLYIFWLVFCK